MKSAERYRQAAPSKENPRELASTPGGSFSGAVAVVDGGATRGDPGFYRGAAPGDPTTSELNPVRKLLGLFQMRYVLM
jgi:hypothetical protein